MTYSVNGINFEGIKGTPQKSKPQIEYYTRLGDKRVWVQKINTSSNESTLTAWQVFATADEADAHIKSVLDIVGKVGNTTFGESSINNTIITNVEYTINKISSCDYNYIVEYTLTVISDLRS